MIALQLDMFAALTPPPPALPRLGDSGDRAIDDAIFDGALAAAYSADTIAMQGIVRKPVRIDGALWVNTGGRWGGNAADEDRISAYRLVPDDGSAVPYNQTEWDVVRGSALGAYHGMAVKCAGQSMMLQGPEVRFMRGGRRQGALL